MCYPDGTLEQKKTLHKNYRNPNKAHTSVNNVLILVGPDKGTAMEDVNGGIWSQIHGNVQVFCKCKALLNNNRITPTSPSKRQDHSKFEVSQGDIT